MDDVWGKALKSREDRVLEKFDRESKGKSKKEVRELERRRLKPTKLLPAKEIRGKAPVEKLTVRLVFATLADVELFKRFFKVNEYKGLNTHHLGMLLEFLECFERGSLAYDEKEGKLEFVNDRGECCTI